jgi:hypothetical protein
VNNSPNRKKTYNVGETRVVNMDRFWICRWPILSIAITTLMTRLYVNVILDGIIWTNVLSVNNSPNRKKNLQCWRDESGEYGSALDLSKNKISVGGSCNSNNGVFEEMVD